VRLFAEQTRDRITGANVVVAQERGATYSWIEIPAIASRRDPLFHHAARGVLELCHSVVDVLGAGFEPLGVFHDICPLVRGNIISFSCCSTLFFIFLEVLPQDLEVQVVEPVFLLDAGKANKSDIFYLPVDVI